MKIGILGLAVASVATMSAASYAGISYNVTADGSAAAGSPITLTFDQFDASKGTLVSVTWTASLVASGGSATVTNNNAGGTATVNVNILNDVTLNSQTVELTQKANNITLNGGNFTTVDLSNDSNSLNGTIDDFSGYTGLGTLSYTTSSLTGWGTSGSGSGADFTVSSTGSQYSVHLVVTYTYDTVPEVASLGMLSLGALALLARRRK